MAFIKFKKAGRWHDKPYQPQFDAGVDQMVELADGSTFDEDGNILTLSHSLAQEIVNAGKGEILARGTPPAQDKAKAEFSAGPKGKAKSE